MKFANTEVKCMHPKVEKHNLWLQWNEYTPPAKAVNAPTVTGSSRTTSSSSPSSLVAAVPSTPNASPSLICSKVRKEKRAKREITESPNKKKIALSSAELFGGVSSSRGLVTGSPMKGKPRKVRTDVECTNCGSSKTPLWRKASDGTVVCNKCGLYLSRHSKKRHSRQQEWLTTMDAGNQYNIIGPSVVPVAKSVVPSLEQLQHKITPLIFHNWAGGDRYRIKQQNKTDTESAGSRSSAAPSPTTVPWTPTCQYSYAELFRLATTSSDSDSLNLPQLPEVEQPLDDTFQNFFSQQFLGTPVEHYIDLPVTQSAQLHPLFAQDGNSDQNVLSLTLSTEDALLMEQDQHQYHHQQPLQLELFPHEESISTTPTVPETPSGEAGLASVAPVNQTQQNNTPLAPLPREPATILSTLQSHLLHPIPLPSVLPFFLFGTTHTSDNQP
eukprot:GEZU01013767.1.p1 GENE.GEZU01013767.1~~GEZU01013767.1.p1  ORF type:complete len:441 (-),score=58.39 GEZU01013767.1:178-1500(-)